MFEIKESINSLIQKDELKEAFLSIIKESIKYVRKQDVFKILDVSRSHTKYDKDIISIKYKTKDQTKRLLIILEEREI